MESGQDHYAIYTMLGFKSQGGLVDRLLRPNGTRHSFLALVRETENGRLKGLAELHFSGKDSKGEFVAAGKKPLNILASLSGFVGLEKHLRYIANKIGLKDSLVRLKGVQTSGRSNIEEYECIGKVHGTQSEILETWNRACGAAVEINKANIPFMPLSVGGYVNCHAGTKAVLLTLGDKFQPIASKLSPHAIRDLRYEVPTLSAPHVVREISLESLLMAQQQLSQSLYETSRVLKGSSSARATFKTPQPQ